MTEEQIKHMVDRFLRWQLPENFSPDCGISFKKTFNEHTAHPMKHEPTGTNLFDAEQAEAMVRAMIEDMHDVPAGEGGLQHDLSLQELRTLIDINDLSVFGTCPVEMFADSADVSVILQLKNKGLITADGPQERRFCCRPTDLGRSLVQKIKAERAETYRKRETRRDKNRRLLVEIYKKFPNVTAEDYVRVMHSGDALIPVAVALSAMAHVVGNTPPPQEPSDVSKWRDAAFTTAANIVTAHFGKDGKACCDDILALRRAKGE